MSLESDELLALEKLSSKIDHAAVASEYSNLQTTKDSRTVYAKILAEEGFYPHLEQYASEHAARIITKINKKIREVNQRIADLEFLDTIKITLINKIHDDKHEDILGVEGTPLGEHRHSNKREVHEAFDVLIEQFVGYQSGNVPQQVIKYLAEVYSNQLEGVDKDTMVARYLCELSTKSFTLEERLQMEKIALIEDKKVLLGVSSSKVAFQDIIDKYNSINTV
jgi:hypothetical protein